MTAQILATLLPVFLIAGCGTLYGRFRTPDIRSINTLNMELFVPMLVFAVLADGEAPLGDYAGLALGGAVIVVGSGVLLWPLVKWLKLNPKTFLPPMMFNNSGNMGIPLLLLAFGEAALPAAVVLFIVEMLLHFSLGLWMLSPGTPLWRLLRMPIVLASIAGLAVNLAGVGLPGWLLEALHMLGGVCIPLLLFALGVRMLEIDFSDWKTGLLGALLTFSPRLWYPVFGSGPLAWGLTPLADQQLAGLIMWVPMALLLLLAGFWIAARGLRHQSLQ